eukprot:2911841-Pyramimonas_sp.AAC.1
MRSGHILECLISVELHVWVACVPVWCDGRGLSSSAMCVCVCVCARRGLGRSLAGSGRCRSPTAWTARWAWT